MSDETPKKRAISALLKLNLTEQREASEIALRLTLRKIDRSREYERNK